MYLLHQSIIDVKIEEPYSLPIGRYGHGVEGVSRVYRPVAGVGNGHDRGAEVRAGGQLGQPQHPCQGETQAQLSKVEDCFYILCLLHLREYSIEVRFSPS